MNFKNLSIPSSNIFFVFPLMNGTVFYEENKTLKSFPIYQGLLLAKKLGIEELVCYFVLTSSKTQLLGFMFMSFWLKMWTTWWKKVILLFVTLSERKINVQISLPNFESPYIMIWFTHVFPEDSLLYPLKMNATETPFFLPK